MFAISGAAGLGIPELLRRALDIIGEERAAAATVARAEEATAEVTLV